MQFKNVLFLSLNVFLRKNKFHDNKKSTQPQNLVGLIFLQTVKLFANAIVLFKVVPLL